jgi:nanoRNase/pAp phosphatase (c-di-AMP/oligoRNAs hydrolase)
MWKPDLCIYHGGCDDGFGAAWAIWMKWGNEVSYVPAYYGKELPDTDGKHVLFVDFSAPYDVLSNRSWRAKSIVVIDHHKTAKADLEHFHSFDGTGADQTSLEEAFTICLTENGPKVAVWFDMNQSGAVMAWEFAHGIPHNDPPPTMLSLIQDRDLWRFAYGDRTKQFSAALRTYPMDFNVWSEIAEAPDKLVEEGKCILRSHNANIQKFIADAYMGIVDGHTVPIVNVPYHYASDTAHELLKKYPDAPFAACWFKRGDGQVQWSLRSEDHRMDVSAVAKNNGGGGHRNAAGFQSGMPA